MRDTLQQVTSGRVRWFVLLGASYLAAALLAMEMARQPGNVASAWIASAIVLAMMLHRPHWAWASLAVAALARITAGVLIGDPWSLVLGYAAANTTGVGLAYFAIRRQGLRPIGLSGVRDSLATLGWAGLFAPTIGGFMAAVLHYDEGLSAFLRIWTTWMVASAFGALVMLPVLLAYQPGAFGRLVSRVGGLRLSLFVAGTLLVSALSVELLARPFIVLSLPLILAAFYCGRFGTALLCAINLGLVAALRLAHAPGNPLDTLTLGSGDQLGSVEFNFYCALTVIAPLLISISEAGRRRAERETRTMRHRLQWIADSTPALIAQFGGDGRAEFANATHRDWLGLDPATMVGQTAATLFGFPDDHPLPAGVRAAREGQSSGFEAAMPDGRVLQFSLVPDDDALADDDPGEAGRVLMLAADITPIKQLQSQLYQEKELAEVTLASIGDAVITTDVDCRVKYLNRMAEEMTGWSSDEALGRPLDEVLALQDMQTGQSGLSPLQIALKDNRIVGLAMNTCLVRRDGMKLAIEDSAAPIRDADGRVVGGVIVFHDVSETRAMALRMSHLAQHDYLTDLPNRVLLQDRLDQALAGIAQDRRGALMFLDLDHFKTINDSLGHEIGDHLLQEVARRLSAGVRPDDTVSRQGGDEFVVLLPRLADPRDAARVAEKLLRALDEPVRVGAHELQVGMSVGIALFPEDGTDATTLLKNADSALYHAKESGRGHYQYYTDSMSAKAERRMEVERDLRRALRAGEFELHFQPKVDAGSRWVTGTEALVRWRPPGGDLVYPGEFIPIAEECGLIDQIDAWVLREACRQNKAWQDAGLLAVPVAVNVSLARFDGERLLALVKQELRDSGLDPGYLDIEFTESQALQDTGRTRLVMEGLREIGVRVAMDDFGTGFSSLSYLQKFRFDVIKIDRSFVESVDTDITQLNIVRAILGMATALGYGVVAEGVESEMQARLLSTHGCAEMQGYLFSRPVPAAAIPALLAKGCLMADVAKARLADTAER